jgi:hypothetical protein
MVQEATTVAAEEADDGWGGRWLCSVFLSDFSPILFSPSLQPTLNATATL